MRDDIFGNWKRGIGEADVPVSPGRSITITPELQAADAAQRAAREFRAPYAWKLPEPVQRTYVLPAGRSSGKRRSKKRKAQPQIAKEKDVTKPNTIAGLADQHFRSSTKTVTYEIGKPVAEADIPTRRGGGPPSPYLPIYEAAAALKDEQYVPVTLARKEATYAVAAALRRLARFDKKLLVKWSPDVRTLYVRLAAEGDSAK